MVAEISMRHFPDMSETSLDPDFSEASFQIPATGRSNDFLLDEDSMDFLRNAEDTIGTPLPPVQSCKRSHLTLQDLTPRSARTQSAPIRSSLRPLPRPVIATPRRAAVAKEIFDAVAEDISFTRSQELSFQIPVSVARGADFLLDDIHAHLPDPADTTLETDAAHPSSPGLLTLSQLSPTKSDECSSSSASSQHVSEHVNQPEFAIFPAEVDDCVGSAEGPAIVAPSEPRTEDSADVVAPCATSRRPAPSVKVDATLPNSTAKRGLGTSKPSDKVKRKKPTVLHGGITKAKATKPNVKGSRTQIVPVSTARRTVITHSRAQAQAPKASAKPKHEITTIRNSSDSAVESGNGKDTAPGHKAVATGGLATALVSYALRLTDGLTSPQIPSEPAPDINLTTSSGPVVITSRQEGIDTDNAVEHLPGTESTSAGIYRDAEANPDSTLTLSQLSPAKPPDDPPAPAAELSRPKTKRQTTRAAPRRPPSPQHPSSKRPASAVSSEASSSSQNKRSKTGPVAREAGSEERAAAAAATQNVTGKSKTAAGGTPAGSGVASESCVRHASADPRSSVKSIDKVVGPSTSRSSVHATVNVGEGVAAGEDGMRAAQGQLTRTRSGGPHSRSVSRSGDSGHSHKENLPGAHGKARRPESADGHVCLPAERPAAALPPAKSTRPIEFHFHSDARIEARKAELEKPPHAGSLAGSMQRSRSHAHLPIPDFKAQHAAQEAALAARREQIVPVVPEEIVFSTDTRAREREKFEQARREREREIEVQMEERRRQREIEDEKEIREMRRRAVPKANEVPEWYAHAPKRGGKARS